MSEVTFQMPATLTPEMLRAVRQNPTTSTEDKDEENRRIGWLLCAWDVLVEHRVLPGPEDFNVPYAAGVAACLEIAKAIHTEAAEVAHPDAEGWTRECVKRIEAIQPQA